MTLTMALLQSSVPLTITVSQRAQLQGHETEEGEGAGGQS